MKISLINWNLIKQNPFTYAKNCSQKSLEKTIKIANDRYYNNSAILEDNEYDILYDYLSSNYPDNQLLNEVGSEVNKKFKVKLPIHLPSMEKIKPDTDSLTNWKKKYKGEYILSDKLDGMSLLVVAKDGKINAYTRGNGSIGQDISYIIKYINIGNLKNGMLRGELIVSKNNWEVIRTIYPKYSNSRNFVSGYSSSQKLDIKLMSLIDFVVYEYIAIESKLISLLEQLQIISELNVNVVYFEKHKDITNTKLTEILQKRRNESKYEIDGIIITDNGLHLRTNKKYPEYAKAFKMVLDDQTGETSVLNIKWEPSMYGILNPVVQISPLKLDSVTINNVTAYNAKFITENAIGGLIGPGSVIQITRSGGVIPKILKVVKKYNGEICHCLPNKELLDYRWTDSKVDIVLKEPEKNEQVAIKRILHFYNTLGVDFLKMGMIKKLYSAGFDSIIKIMNIQKSDLLKIDGIKEKSAEKILNTINKTYNSSNLIDLMASHYSFGSGFGKKKLKPIIDNIPDIISNDLEDYYIKQIILELPGFHDTTVNKFLIGLPKFKEFYKLLPKKDKPKVKFIVKKQKKSTKLEGRIFCCTGFRPDSKLKDYIISNGGVFEDTIKKNVTDIIVKSKESPQTSKVKKAIENNLNISYLNDYV